MRFPTLGIWLIVAGGNILFATIIFAILIPRLPIIVLSVVFSGAIVVLMLGNFVLIFSSFRKKMVRRCNICQSDITGRAFPFWKNPHYESVHHDYSLWLKDSWKRFFLIAVPSMVILASLEYLWLKYGGVYSYLGGLAVLSWIIFGFSWSIYYWMKVRSFKRGWKNNHQA